MYVEEKEIWWVYSTFPGRAEAISCARGLLERQLIACANCLENATSLYCWEGGIREETEVVMIAKTSASRRREAMEALKALHPYAVPCIVALPVPEGVSSFTAWVNGQLAAAAPRA